MSTTTKPAADREPMTDERIAELRAAAEVQAGANPHRSYISALLHTHGAILLECLDEITRQREASR